MANTYIINTERLKSRVLDDTSSFPPTSKYKLIITPDPGKIIQAAQYAGKEMPISYEGDTNSHTKWPSRFQYNMPGLELGLREFPTFYKIVFEDSTNSYNDPNWIASEDNSVFVWIYFGKNETTSAQHLTNTDIIITYSPTLNTQDEVVSPLITTNNINSFNF
jgi:hypothetical protein|tara:strand:- start:244 stop:732 length:489 start_codon:yes stop_codon:yes gene_type:complete